MASGFGYFSETLLHIPKSTPVSLTLTVKLFPFLKQLFQVTQIAKYVHSVENALGPTGTPTVSTENCNRSLGAQQIV